MAVNITTSLLRSITRHYKTDRIKHAAQEANFRYLPPAMNLWFPRYDISTPLRVTHFLAQSRIETADFSTLTENAAQKGMEYEPGTNAGRLVGNHRPGDGPKYVGRGLLHLTGHDNYKKYGDKLREDLVSHPERVAKEYDLAVRTSCAFWQSRGLNKYADMDNFIEITRRVNGGFNGRAERERVLKEIKPALHVS